MEYEEYTKRYCNNCANKDCTRIPVNNDGSLIDKNNPNICRYFKRISDYEKIIEKLEDIITILKVKHECELRDGKCTSEDIIDHAERYGVLKKVISLVEYVGENDLVKRDDIYNLLEYECSSLEEAIKSICEVDKIDLDYLDRVDVEG